MSTREYIEFLKNKLPEEESIALEKALVEAKFKTKVENHFARKVRKLLKRNIGKNDHGVLHDKGSKQICDPNLIIKEIALAHYHGGCSGITTTFYHLKSQFVNITRNMVSDFIKNCPNCAKKHEIVHQKPEVDHTPLKTLSIPESTTGFDRFQKQRI